MIAAISEGLLKREIVSTMLLPRWPFFLHLTASPEGKVQE
jgi:hypothetical protein